MWHVYDNNSPQNTHSEKPFHLRRYSTLPFTTRRFRTFSTTYSSSSSSSSGTSSGFLSFFSGVVILLSGWVGNRSDKQIVTDPADTHPVTAAEPWNWKLGHVLLCLFHRWMVNHSAECSFKWVTNIYSATLLKTDITLFIPRLSTHTLPHKDKWYREIYVRK